MQKLIRITTVPLSLEKLLEGQLTFMSRYFQVTAISAEKRRLKEFSRNNGVNSYHVEMTREITPLKDFWALWKLYNFFRREKPTIVHTHTPKAGITGMLAAKLAGVPIRLHTVAGMPLMESRGLKRSVLRKVEELTYWCATRVYPNSMGLRDFIVDNNFTAKKKLKVLGSGSSNGIDTSFFDPNIFSCEDIRNLKQDLEIPLEDKVFIFVGRLVGDKGVNELVAAFLTVQKKENATSLLLVGPFEQDLDPIAPETMKQIEKHPKLFAVGYQKDVRPFFAISDVLVFPSYREGFPNVVMQAGAMGLPSIVSDINGCNEIIEEGLNGTIVPVKDVDLLELAMENLITNSCYLQELRQGSRKKIIDNYERKQFWGLLLAEYRMLTQSSTVKNLKVHDQ